MHVTRRWDTDRGACRLVASPNFSRLHIWSDNAVGIEMKPAIILLDKALGTGSGILNISKTYLYSFHYDYMQAKYAARAELVYCDTDSLIYHVHTEDFYKDMREANEDDSTGAVHFDTSAYEANNPYRIEPRYAGQPGLMKDECNGRPLLRVCALRAKLYSYETED